MKGFPESKADYKAFSNHKYEFWDHFVKKSPAFALRIIMDSKEFMTELIAVEVMEMKTPDAEFDSQILKEYSSHQVNKSVHLTTTFYQPPSTQIFFLNLHLSILHKLKIE